MSALAESNFPLLCTSPLFGQELIQLAPTHPWYVNNRDGSYSVVSVEELGASRMAELRAAFYNANYPADLREALGFQKETPHENNCRRQALSVLSNP